MQTANKTENKTENKETFIIKKALEYASKIVQFESITPFDDGCQDWIEGKLKHLGAKIERFECGGIQNLIAVVDRGEGKNLAFCGHTDVVPVGDISKWKHPPFSGAIDSGMIYGRGIADMKGAIAAAIASAEYLVYYSNFKGKLFFLITGDEEAEAEHGSFEIVKWLSNHDIKLDYCIIGEPSSFKKTGDMIKIGRRGSVSFDLTLFGKSAHVAYPLQGVNAVQQMSEVISQLSSHKWKLGSEDFPGTSLQVTYFNSGNWTDNIVPSKASISMNIRYNTEHTEIELLHKIENIVRSVTSNYEIKSYRSCEPYLSQFTNNSSTSLIDLTEKAIKSELGWFPRVSTSGGTSDGRFFKRICPQIIEIGLPNGTIHQENERVSIKDIESLCRIYCKVFEYILVEPINALRA
ncbi:succinyl-diaminopimelate desuccinylase [Shewanella surugensis]|uniref:Succinyl-diaminopimelate desuccinylase n=1 Tax=Shewanella surugensis TaxID=212020 RepID=A0ABT0LKQ4_9GAMM|nr:succinyl-diaminopimelate desuccinylase [Shewanella surugensis]MCL1127975.1 succinyl-diaminopimelate desuccinylase [Shewanella surugensis]